jgi:hypothetical protein
MANSAGSRPLPTHVRLENEQHRYPPDRVPPDPACRVVRHARPQTSTDQGAQTESVRIVRNRPPALASADYMGISQVMGSAGYPVHKGGNDSQHAKSKRSFGKIGKGTSQLVQHSQRRQPAPQRLRPAQNGFGCGQTRKRSLSRRRRSLSSKDPGKVLEIVEEQHQPEHRHPGSLTVAHRSSKLLVSTRPAIRSSARAAINCEGEDRCRNALFSRMCGADIRSTAFASA